MRLAILYGHHIEETEFGLEISEEFLRRHPPAREISTFHRIQHQIPADSSGDLERQVDDEIRQLVVDDKPDIMIDIHHSKGSLWEAQWLFPQCIILRYENYDVDIRFGKFLESQKRRPYSISLIKSQKSIDLRHNGALVRTATKNRTRYLATEVLRFGEEWNFPNNEINDRIFESGVRLLYKLYKYAKDH